MAYASPEFVVRSRSRAWPTLVFVLVLLYGIWFTIVLLGEQRAWTDDPAQWAGLHTTVWAWLGLGIFILAILYYLILLVRREVPPQTYVLRGAAGEGTTPGFLREGEAAQAPAGSPPQPPQS